VYDKCAANRLLDDFVKACQPRRLKVVGHSRHAGYQYHGDLRI